MIIFIQARFNSRRLPGKVLKKIQGKTLLGWILHRLSRLNFDIPIAILTSHEKSDDPIVDFCISENIKYYRGDLNNVASRFLNAAIHFNEKEFIRISGDSPLIDPKIVDKAFKISKEVKYDLITNVLNRTYPKGQSIEIIKLKALEKLLSNNLTLSEKEHVTKGFYFQKNKFKIFNFEAGSSNYNSVQLCVDSLDDFQIVNKIIKTSINDKKELLAGWKDLVSIYNELLIK